MKFQSITAVINWNALNTLDTPSSLLGNLTENMKDRQNRLPSNLRRHQQRDAEFADLVNYFKVDTVLLVGPIFYRAGLDNFMDKAQMQNLRKRGVKTYATKTRSNRGRRKNSKPLSYVSENYDMNNCKKFLELSVNERSRYLVKNDSVLGAMILYQVTISSNMHQKNHM